MNLSAPTQEDYLFGGLFVGLSIISVIPNVLFIMVVHTNKELHKTVSYKYMAVLSYLNIGMLVFNLITGFFTMFQTVVHPLFNKFVGAIGMPLYTAYVLLSMVLAINCLAQFLKIGFLKNLFEPKNAKKWYVVPFLGFLSVFLFYASPWASIIYFPNDYYWDKDEDRPYSYDAIKFEQVIELTGMVITGILYLLVFGLIIKMKKKFLKSKNYNQEMRVFVQTFLIALINIILNFFWYNPNLVLPPVKEAATFNIFGGIFNCVINPITYIIVNKTIRRRFRAIKPTTRITPIKRHNGSKNGTTSSPQGDNQ